MTRGLARADRVRFVSDLLRTLGAADVRATATTATGDATRAARDARDAGADRVIVWGGDGTLNEVASVLVGSRVPIGIVAGGSGNGVARGLGLPLDVTAAVTVAMTGSPRDIDTGLVDGRTFLNLAGMGLDAAVAQRFNTANTRRGLGPYVSSILHEWRTFESQRFSLQLDDAPSVEVHAHVVAVCNGQQYGHGARIAPDAAFDDGWLDVVAVPPITTMRIVRHGWRLFHGTLTRVPGVFAGRARRVTIAQERPLALHLDGEVIAPARTRTFEVRPHSLRVLVPA